MYPHAMDDDDGGGGGGCDGFFLACEEDLGEKFEKSFPASVFFFLFPKWRSVRTHQFHSLGEDQSTNAQRAETIVEERSLTSCV